MYVCSSSSNLITVFSYAWLEKYKFPSILRKTNLDQNKIVQYQSFSSLLQIVNFQLIIFNWFLKISLYSSIRFIRFLRKNILKRSSQFTFKKNVV